MKPAAIFSLAVRLLGVWFIYLAVRGLSTCFLSAISFFHEVAVAGGAVWCLFGAPPVQNWAYPEDAANRPPQIPTGNISPFAEPTRSCVRCNKPMSLDAKFCSQCGWTQPTS